VSALLGAAAFGFLVFLSTLGGERLAHFERPRDRSRALRVVALRAGLCVAAAVNGGILLAHRAPPDMIFAIAILCATLGVVCFLAALDCRVPLAVPGAALAILIGAALLRGDGGPLASAATTAAPFALTAIFAPQARTGWRDTLVAALGGAAFGLPLGLVLAGAACLALALARPYLARYRTTPPPPAGFSSVLAGAFLVALIGQLTLT